jgi:sugar/nucleoside kinase (ribokinase family)
MILGLFLDEYLSVGIDTKYLQISNKFPTTSSYIIANTSIGSRTILTSRAQDIKMNLPIFDENEFDYILFDGYEKEVALEAIAKNPNAITLLDAGSVKEATVELAYMVDYLICSHDFAIEFSKVEIDYNDIDTIRRAYDALEKEFKHNVIITLEALGCFTKINGEYKLIPSISVVPVDSTGAGDIYHGAFMYGLTQGFDLEKTMRFANITGALSCLRVGSRLSIPDLDEVVKAYNDNL